VQTSLGCCVNYTVDDVIRYYQMGFRTFQVMFGNSMGKEAPNAMELHHIREEIRRKLFPKHPDDLNFVVHAPLWYNFVKDNWLTSKTIGHMTGWLTMCEAIGAKWIVAHPGYRASMKDISDDKKIPTTEEAIISIKNAVEFLLPQTHHSQT